MPVKISVVPSGTATPIRVCHIVGNMDGTVGASLMNYHRHMDRDRVQFDFVVCGPDVFVPQDEIEALGGRVYRTCTMSERGQFKRECYQLFSEHFEWTMVEAHLNELSAVPLKQAERACVTMRIAHGHGGAGGNSGDQRLRKKTTKRSIVHFASDTETGTLLFGENQQFEVVPDLAEPEGDIDEAAPQLQQMYEFLSGWTEKYNAQ
jgi:hypothetical protein